MITTKIKEMRDLCYLVTSPCWYIFLYCPFAEGSEENTTVYLSTFHALDSLYRDTLI